MDAEALKILVKNIDQMMVNPNHKIGPSTLIILKTEAICDLYLEKKLISKDEYTKYHLSEDPKFTPKIL